MAKSAGRIDGVDAITFVPFDNPFEVPPLFTVRVNPDWREDPREPLGETGRWTLTRMEEGTILEQGVLPPVPYWQDDSIDVCYLVNEEPFLRRTHDSRARGAEVYFIEEEEEGSLQRATIYGADGWPIRWVRIGIVEWEQQTQIRLDPRFESALILFQAYGALEAAREVF